MFSQESRCIYEKNQLIEVICQLRFPDILKIEAQEPYAFQDAIRGEYPQYAKKVEQLPPQQGPPHRDAAAGRCLHFRCRAAGAGGHQAEGGAGEKLPQHGADCRQRDQQPQQRRDISARSPAQQQPAALRQPFPAAPQRRGEEPRP